MSSSQQLEQKLAKLILAPGQEAIPLPGLAASPDSLRKKVGPAPPPKVKKAQPQVATPSKDTQQTIRTGNLPPAPAASFGHNVYSNVPIPPPPPPPAYPGTQNTYSNINNYSSVGNLRIQDMVEEDLPPPPPLPEPGTYSAESAMNFPPPPPEEFMSPPSPVSSSYSELRRATGPTPTPKYPPPYGAGYVAYQAPSDSSTYESLYEPLNPRPPSEMSSRGSYSLYGPFGQQHAPHPSTQPVTNPEKRGREAEVDALTSMLVRSMDEAADPEFFGICNECGTKISGEGNGCTAMGSLYHIKCFVCYSCRNPLRDKPFYDVDGKPHCHDCYMETLEKCNVCMKPILERILRATGKPYHPQCFTCTVCKKCLDNVPFTVDASNQVYCIEDFHRKFAPRCSVCKEPIMPEPGKDETIRVVALDRSFHVQCYRCEDCGLVLSSEAEGRGCYPLDGHVLCKNCNGKRIRALTSSGSTEL